MIILIYYIIILWDHRRICGQSLNETPLCGAGIYATWWALQAVCRIEAA